MSLRSFLRRISGREARDDPRLPTDTDERTRAILECVRPYTMTSAERVIAMVEATRHISGQAIPGAVVECGVWRGGSMMAAALALREAGDTGRALWLYDTFTGMPPPGKRDITCEGVPAADEWKRRVGDAPWCQATRAEVEAAMATVDYPGPVRLVAGRVEDTLPAQAPNAIAILRLDLDWYEPTRHAFAHLYPLLQPGGILILDDHGHWQGARQAVEELLQEWQEPLFLARIDYTGRIAVKPAR